MNGMVKKAIVPVCMAVCMVMLAFGVVFSACGDGSKPENGTTDQNDDIDEPDTDRLIPAGLGYARTSVNNVPFRNNSIVTEGTTQYITFYDDDGYVMIGKRELGDTEFETIQTEITGEPTNAHNNISIITDGDGVIHLTVNFHNGHLHYYRGQSPGSLNLTRRTMIGQNHGSVADQENQVTYTEFYRLPSGDLIFVYRNGTSGNGDMVLNRYSVSSRR